jgi:uncharacterized protein YceK
MTKFLIFLVASVSLAGCGSISLNPQALENRVACTVARDTAFGVSQYGPVGITSQLAKTDTEVLCKKEAAVPVPVAPIPRVLPPLGVPGL